MVRTEGTVESEAVMEGTEIHSEADLEATDQV